MDPWDPQNTLHRDVRATMWKEFAGEPLESRIEQRSSIGADSALGLNALGIFDSVSTERTSSGLVVDYVCRGCGRNVTITIDYVELVAVASAGLSPTIAFGALGLRWSTRDRRSKGDAWLRLQGQGETYWVPRVSHSRQCMVDIGLFGITEAEALGHVAYAMRRGWLGPRSVVGWFVGRVLDGEAGDGVLHLAMELLRAKLLEKLDAARERLKSRPGKDDEKPPWSPWDGYPVAIDFSPGSGGVPGTPSPRWSSPSAWAALASLQAQPRPDGNNCHFCGDNDHQAFDCYAVRMALGPDFSKAYAEAQEAAPSSSPVKEPPK